MAVTAGSMTISLNLQFRSTHVIMFVAPYYSHNLHHLSRTLAAQSQIRDD